MKNGMGAWVAQGVELPTLGFGSGLALGVVRSSPAVMLEFLSPLLSALPPCTLSFSVK